MRELRLMGLSARKFDRLTRKGSASGGGFLGDMVAEFRFTGKLFKQTCVVLLYPRNMFNLA